MLIADLQSAVNLSCMRRLVWRNLDGNVILCNRQILVMGLSENMEGTGRAAELNGQYIFIGKLFLYNILNSQRRLLAFDFHFINPIFCHF